MWAVIRMILLFTNVNKGILIISNFPILGDEVLLSKLYSFIDTDEPLNPLLASFFSRTIGVLVARASDQVNTKTET